LEKVYQLKPEEVEQSLDGEISLAKAAELLVLHPLKPREEFGKAGVPLRLGAQTFEEAQAKLKAFESLKEPTS